MPAASRKKSLRDRILLVLNWLTGLGLVMAYLAYYIPPDFMSVFGYAAIGYPVLLLVQLLFVLYWAIRLKRQILLPLVFIGIGALHLPRAYGWGQTRIATQAGESLKVMSFNVRLFNRYDWLDQEDVTPQIVKLVQEENPDVLLMQEYYESEDDPAWQGLDFPYQSARINKFKRKDGLVIFSKYPITGSQTIPMEEQPGQKTSFHLADIEWQGRPIRFINVHLASIGLEAADHTLLDQAGQMGQDDLKSGTKRILQRIHWAFLRRTSQMDHVLKAIDDSPYPVVITGDFNDVPQSYAYHRVASRLEDSFYGGGRGFGATYTKSPLPLRIDFIFHDPALQAFNYRVIRQKLSDHYPVISELRWAK